MHEVIITGSGPSGVAAALELSRQGIKPLILDVGYQSTQNAGLINDNFYRYREKHDAFDLMIGNRLQGLSNLLADRRVPVKLTAPHFEYVTKDAEIISPVDETNFRAIQSFAMGGLANAWGAGLYRFTKQELAGFPLGESDLDPFYETLTEEIGICGTDDALTPFFGPCKNLLPPLRKSHNVKKLYGRYLQKKAVLEANGVYLGHPRVGVLSESRDGRPAFDYSNLEFWQPSPAIYTPKLTLDKLIAAGKVVYRSGIRVDQWHEREQTVEVEGIDLKNHQGLRFETKTLVLAAGTLNTSKIVLRSFEDCTRKLRLLENPALQIPLVLPGSLGRRLDKEAFGLVQLNLVWNSIEFDALLQGSILEITSPMRAEFFQSLPFSAHANLALIRYLLPAMLVLQLFFPAPTQQAASLSLQSNGRLRIQGGADRLDTKKVADLLKNLRRLGAYTHPALLVEVPTGHAVHYAGSLPMKVDPGLYECDTFGQIHGTRQVYIADAACFPELPAKNMSFTMMANAMRIANQVSKRIKDLR